MVKSSQIFTDTLLLLTGILTGCNNNSISSGNALNINTNEEVLIKGAGASFPAPLYQKWIQEYTSEKNNSNIKIDYDSVGSGKGVQNFLAENVDFGASDAPLKTEEREKFPLNRGKAIQVPMTGGLVVFAYNLSNYEGLDNIRLSRNSYCGIVTGQIKKWNDSAIAQDNPNVNLPNLPLIFVHRADGSGKLRHI